MKGTAYGPLNVTIRSKENNLLSRNHLERMIGADTYDEAVNILRETAYRNDVDRIKEDKNYDEMFMNELQEAFDVAFTNAPDKDVIEIMALRYAYHNLKVMFKENFCDDNFEHLYINIGRYSTTELRKAVHTGQSDVLPELYLNSIQEVKEDLEEYNNAHAIDIILDRRYFMHLKALAEQTGEAVIVELVVKKIDHYNISTLIRAKRQKRTNNFLSAILSNAGTFDKDELIRRAESGVSDLMAYLKTTRYASQIDEINDDEYASIKLDRVFDDAYMKKMREARLESFGPLPVLAFLNAKEIEVTNLRLILSGKENNLDSDSIRERMRLSYGQ